MFLIFSIFLSTIVLAQDIFPGSSLSASNLSHSWNSPNNTFSLSFIKEAENRYFAAITYNDIPVWKAGGDPGGAADSSATLRLLPSGNLELVNGSTGSLVWQSNTTGLGITAASLDDSGNFILKNGRIPRWTTFDHPTDTIVTGQNFTVNHVLRSGLYSFRLWRSGRIILQWNNSIEYYSSLGINSSSDLNLTSPSLGIQPVGIFSLYDPMLSSPEIMARSNDYGEVSSDVLRFVRLDGDGNLRMYGSARSNGSGSKTVRWTAVSDQCQVFGYCGNLGVCKYDDEFNPVCGCPSENFEPVDVKDPWKGCKRKNDIQNCQATMLPLDHASFLTYPPEYNSEYYTASITACRSICLTDANCMASTSLADGTGVCFFKRSLFLSAYQSPTLTSTSYVKVCEPAMPSTPLTEEKPHTDHDRLKIAVLVLGVSLVLFILAAGSIWIYYMPKLKHEGLLSQNSLSDYASGLPVQFSYKELQQATKGFKEKLGQGGFGAVYRGVLPNKFVVAVKRLEGIEQGEKQFRMEVATISSTHHLNLVRLYGFCSEGRHRLLVYEFMKNGSLDSFLFPSKDEPEKEVLSWACRYNIVLGTARAITYLHEECRDPIVHCDIKPENILLDDNYKARVSDFGLARLINLNDQRHRSVRGTRGYLAPEWLANLPVNPKTDIYSFGMVLLEIVSRKRNFEVSDETDHRKFTSWAYDEFEKGNVNAIIDKRLLSHEADIEQVMRVIQVSFWCIQEQPSHRPSMGKVVQMLEGIAAIHKPPPPTNLATEVHPVVSPFQPAGSVSRNSSQSDEHSSSTFLRGDEKV